MLKRDKVVIIIVSYNGREYFSALMPPLVQEKYHDFDIEIVLVDNNSSDGSVDFVKNNFPSVYVIANQDNTGFVGGNNIGYQWAKDRGADYIYLLNQDTVVSPGFLEPLYKFAREHSQFGSLQSKLRLWPKKDRINTLGNAIHFLGFGYGTESGKIDHNDQKIKKISYASGAGEFLSMEALEKKGELFDDTMFLYLEDLDLGWQLQMLGYDNYLIPKSIIYHKYEFKRSIKQYYWFERNRLWTMLKNYKTASLVIIFPAWLVMEFGQLLFALLNKNLKQKIRSYSFLFSKSEMAKLREKRKQIQSIRTRSDRQVISKFTGLILFQPLSSVYLKTANIIFFIYWQIIKIFIFW